VLTDGRRWHEWAGVGPSSLEREGDDAPNGVGSIRRLGYPPLAGSREQVVEHQPPAHLGYVILSGSLPVRRYRSDLWLEERPGGGTELVWSGTFDPLVPGSARAMEALLAATIRRFARRAVAHAESTT
jgi:hypothetical protein